MHRGMDAFDTCYDFLAKDGCGKILFNRIIPAYQSGILTAVGMSMGKEQDSVSFITTNEPFKIRMTADRVNLSSDPNDLSFITVEVLDDHDNVVQEAELPIRFEISGPGQPAGVVSGNPKDMASFKQPVRNTFPARCLLIIRHKENETGIINIKATFSGLEPGQNKVEVMKN